MVNVGSVGQVNSGLNLSDIIDWHQVFKIKVLSRNIVL